MNSLPSPSLGYCFLFLCVFSPYMPANTAGKIVDTGNKMNGKDWVCIGQEHAAMLAEGDIRCLWRIALSRTQAQPFPWEMVYRTHRLMWEHLWEVQSLNALLLCIWGRNGHQESSTSSWSHPLCLSMLARLVVFHLWTLQVLHR